jgi:hypothetical protein
MTLAVWDVTASTLVGIYLSFREVFCIHLQGNLAVQILTSQKIRIKTPISLLPNEFVQRKSNYAVGLLEFPLGIILVTGTFWVTSFFVMLSPWTKNAEIYAGISPYTGGLRGSAF